MTEPRNYRGDHRERPPIVLWCFRCEAYKSLAESVLTAPLRFANRRQLCPDCGGSCERRRVVNWRKVRKVINEQPSRHL